MMKRLLAFSFFPAFVPPKSGGESRLYNFYFQLSARYQVTLLSSGYLDAEREVVWHTNSFQEIRVPKDAAFARAWQELSPHAGSGDISGPCVGLAARDWTELHLEYLRHCAEADVVVHESPFTIGYDLFAGIDGKPRIYNSYNCEAELYRTLHAEARSSPIHELVQQLEVRTLRQSRAVTYCNDNDLREFERLAGEKITSAVYIPNGVTLVRSASERPAPARLRRAIFLGSGHLPNAHAAAFICDELAPRCPDITFDIIGSCLAARDLPDNVVRHGVVDAQEKSRLLAEADIAVNPMIDGGGSSLKILDFFAHDLPVLSTPIGLRGFDLQHGVDCLVAPAQDFPRVLAAYAKKPADLAALAVHARSRLIRDYSWAAIGSRFGELLERLFTEAPGSALPGHVLALNDYDPFASIGGGGTRLRGLYAAIAEWRPVVVLCFGRGQGVSVEQIDGRIWCIRVPKMREHLDEELERARQFHISVADIVASRHVAANPVAQAIYGQLRREARIVVCDHPYMVDLPASHGDRFVYSSHNHELELKTGLLQWHPDRDALLAEVVRVERQCIELASLAITVSQEDADRFLAGAMTAAPMLVVPNGASPPAIPSAADRQTARDCVRTPSAVFIGSAHMPNVEAAKFIVEILAPACPEVEFHVIGSACQSLGTPLPRNVVAWGVVGEGLKSAVLEACTVAINPMFSGSGSNVKVADFLGHGLHVVSTGFGVRGYPPSITPHVTTCEASEMAATLLSVIDNRRSDDTALRIARREIFDCDLSMTALGARFAQSLAALCTPKRRMLFVTYRYSWPTRGGAESMLASLLRGIDATDDFSIDVVAPAVSEIHELGRFASTYEFEARSGAMSGLRHTRFVRFPVTPPDATVLESKLATAWRAQVEFEKHCHLTQSGRYDSSGLTWGWGSPEGSSERPSRWAFTEFGIHLRGAGEVRMSGYAPHPVVLRAQSADAVEVLHKSIESHFEIVFPAEAGLLMFHASKGRNHLPDTRPLALYISELRIAGETVSLGAPSLPLHPVGATISTIYERLADASEHSRHAFGVRLGDMRGPHCESLDAYLDGFTKDYDLIVTHNSVFRPAIAAVDQARRWGVPSILIPHAHLDDDFYHFPDVHQAALDADLVLAAPRATCAFYEKQGARVGYLPSGIDASAAPTAADVDAFRKVYADRRPFFLVLGRKAAAKGYRSVVQACERLGAGFDARVVLIGHDDDHLALDSARASYLGPQPTDVVNGAIRSCAALINMSTSESFGMVLLEAWRAHRPVIVNRDCAAFHDLAEDEINALMVGPEQLTDAMARLLRDPSLSSRLGDSGYRRVKDYDWPEVIARFHTQCRELIESHGAARARSSEGAGRTEAAPLEAPVTALPGESSPSTRESAPAGLPPRTSASISAMVSRVLERHARRQLTDTEFRGLRLLRRPVRSVLDIGANVGQSIVSLRQIFPNAAITSFEVNPMLHNALDLVARHVGGKVVVQPFGLSSVATRMTLHVPHVGDEPFLEESSLDATYFELPWVAQKFRERGGMRLVEVEGFVRRGDELGLMPDVIKIDVEGAEAEVIIGLRETIMSSRPALLVENSKWDLVTPLLKDMGYAPFRYDAASHCLRSFTGASTNTYYLSEADRECVTS